MRIVEIRQEPIELYKLLKVDNMVESGGEAKLVIAEGLVRVNGVVETRKRKKIVAGDIIEFQHEKVQVSLKASMKAGAGKSDHQDRSDQ